MANGSRTPGRRRAEGSRGRPLRGLLLLAGLAVSAAGSVAEVRGGHGAWYDVLLHKRVQISEYNDLSAHRILDERHNLAWSRPINRFAADLAGCRLADRRGRPTVKTSFAEWMRAGNRTRIEQGLINWMLGRMENEYEGLTAVTHPLRERLKRLIDEQAPPDDPRWLALYEEVRTWRDRLAVFDGRRTLVDSARFLKHEFPDAFACDPAQVERNLRRLDDTFRARTRSLAPDQPEAAAVIGQLAEDYRAVRDTVDFGLFGLSAYADAHNTIDLKDEFHRRWTTIRTQMSSDLTEAEYYAGKVAEVVAVEGNRGIFKPEWIGRAALCSESLINDAVKTPSDVLLLRITALVNELRKDPRTDVEKLALLEARIERVRQAVRRTPGNLRDAGQALFFELCRIQRDVALLNPLLDFDRLLFVKHPHPHYTQGGFAQPQYFGTNAVGDGGLFILENPFSTRPALRDLTADAACENGRLQGRKLDHGDFVSPELTWDGQTIYFAWTEHENGLKCPDRNWVCEHRTPETTYHLFRVGVNGTGLRQITDGPYNDFDPVELPNGRIAFISERRGGYGRSGPYRVYTLHTMEPDGSDIVRISHGETNEWHPSIDHDGQIVYTRWNIWDRQYFGPTNMWVTKPDGRDARAPVGNYQFGVRGAINRRFRGCMPWGMFDIRAVPDSRKFMALVSSYFDYAYGSVILIDPARSEYGDLSKKIQRLTPDQTWPGQGEQNRFAGPCRYATPWPLSERFFLCGYDPGARFEHGPLNRYALYLVDAFGNKVLIYRDPDVACQSPMPVRARSRPPVIPHATGVGRPEGSARPEKTGLRAKTDAGFKVNVADPISPTAGQSAHVGVVDVYRSTHPFPEGARIKALRIVQVAMKTVPGRNNPVVGYGQGTGWDKGGRMVLGTVPVEEDGSAYFNMPAGVPVYFQAIDDEGLALQVMRDITYAHPQERLVCLGCHEPGENSPDPGTGHPLAFRRPPSSIAPDVPESNPLTFPRLVQPVLDTHCIACHKPGGDAPDLTRGNWRNGKRIVSRGRPTLVGTEYWYRSYRNLENYVHCFKTHLSDPLETIPGTFGARVSPLYALLKDGHKGVRLTGNEMHRLVLWMDCNCMFYSATTELERQAAGDVVLPRHE